MDALPTIMTPEEAAAALRISRTRVFQLLAAGELVGFKVGRVRRVTGASVAAWARARVAEAEATHTGGAA